MKRPRSAKANRRSCPGLPSEVVAGIRRAPAVPPVDDPDAELPGVFVEQVQLEAAAFWREWKRVQRASTHRVPVLLTRRRRSKWLIVMAAEDLLALIAALRALEDHPR